MTVTWDQALTDCEARLDAAAKAFENGTLAAVDPFSPSEVDGPLPTALAERAPVGIFLSQAGLRLGYVNQYFADLAGVVPSQLTGTGWQEIAHASGRQVQALRPRLSSRAAGRPHPRRSRRQRTGQAPARGRGALLSADRTGAVRTL